MYFYKDSNNLFHIDGDILPPGNYELEVLEFDTIVSVETADTHLVVMAPIEISLLQKENGDAYVSLAELLFYNAEFFSMVTDNAAAGDHDVIANVRYAAPDVLQGHIDNLDQIIGGNKKFANQAHAGDNEASFSASQTFDLDDGNNQEMPVTGDTTVEVSNEEAGTYLLWLPVISGTPTITIGTSFGDVLDNSGTLLNADGDVNLITFIVSPSGLKKYSINIQTA